MKPSIRATLLSLVCFVLFASQSAIAQQKVAYIDSESIIPLMPEYVRAKSEVEAYGKQLERQLKSKEEAMAKYYQDIMAKAQNGELTPKQEEEAQAALAKMQEDLQKAAAQADESLVAKEAELTKPMYEKFDSALKAVAKAKGYSYILDKKLLLYSEGGIDATSELKTQLGI